MSNRTPGAGQGWATAIRTLPAVLLLGLPLWAGAAAPGTPAPGYYQNPLDLPMVLSANFGEMRADHLHSGIDIKTGGVQGQKVRAAADGYVARLVVNPFGFGRAAYIAHPNGTMTVYGHLRNFSDTLEKAARADMYRRGNWKSDLALPAGRYPVKKGDVIGLSGNSGVSMGPHLHFEVRQSASQRTLNPLSARLFPVQDDIAPWIVKLYYFQVDTVRGVPVHSKPLPVEVRQLTPGDYVPADTLPLEVGPRGYFAVEVTDRKNGTQNTMGAYRLTESLDGQPVFDFTKDNFLFENTRYINSVSVYPLQKGARTEIYRLALQAGNLLPSYRLVRNRGLITPADTLAHEMVIGVEDDNGNASRLTFAVRLSAADGGEQTLFYTPEEVSGPVADYRKTFTSDRDGIGVTIPARALYESIFYTQRIDSLPLPDRADPTAAPASRTKAKQTVVAGLKWPANRPVYSPLCTVHTPDVPLHQRITVEIPADVPDSLRPKATLAVVTSDGRLAYAGGGWRNGRVTAPLRSFGTYCVVTDTAPPRIMPAYKEGADLRKATSVSLVVADDFSGIADYSCRIDGKWELFEYDMKTHRITHTFDPSIPKEGRPHDIVVEVTDKLGNKSLYRGVFMR